MQNAHRDAHLSAIYIQPVTMNGARRADLLRVVEKLNLPIIEKNKAALTPCVPAPLAAASQR
jgi:hypothetical protein